MNKTDNLAVFVYGTLKPGGTFWAKYCEGKVVEKVPARIRGKLFVLNAGYPGMVKDPKAGWVRGWKLVLRDEAALQGFDELEDYKPERPESENEYTRARVECFADDDADTPKFLGEAWTYFMTIERVRAYDGVELPDGLWG